MRVEETVTLLSLLLSLSLSLPVGLCLCLSLFCYRLMDGNLRMSAESLGRWTTARVVPDLNWSCGRENKLGSFSPAFPCNLPGAVCSTARSFLGSAFLALASSVASALFIARSRDDVCLDAFAFLDTGFGFCFCLCLSVWLWLWF